ncbi:MAG: BMC domain-containing protein [Actinobacteria bacterium]|nr:BMC domain-containing protein [Actinomycetota bacterium]
MPYKSIGVIEFISIPKGVEATDAMLKAANVELLQAIVLCPGKFISLIAGEVAAVQSSIDAAKSVGNETLVDYIVIPNVHPGVFPALLGSAKKEELNAVGIIETFTVSSVIIAADSAAKAASVNLIEIRIARGMSGKASVLMSGDVAAVRSAVENGVGAIKTEGALIDFVVIPSPHPDLWEKYF